jgi:sterol 3beta-glucosyltransferase
MLDRIATVKDDGTVVVDVPSLEPTIVGGSGTEDIYTEVAVEDTLDGTEIPYRPPMQIVILIVGTRGDVQPFVAIGKRLQVSPSLSIQFSCKFRLGCASCN